MTTFTNKDALKLLNDTLNRDKNKLKELLNNSFESNEIFELCERISNLSHTINVINCMELEFKNK